MPFLPFVLLLCLSSFARWANKSDFSYSVADFKTITTVKKDGTFSVEREVVFEVLQESAREKFSLFSVPYPSSSATMKVLEAKVFNGAAEVSVTPDKIVEKSVANKTGFDDSKEIQIAFPQVQVGSKLRLKTLTHVTKVVVPGHFSDQFVLGLDGPHDGGSYEIRSEVPLKHTQNDPFKAFDFIEKNEGNLSTYTIKLRGPYLHQLTEEAGRLPAEKVSFFSFSTDSEWGTIGQNMKSRFDPLLNTPAPPELNPVIAKAKLVPDLKGRVNYLLSYIVQNYNYVGDWRTLSAGFTPRKTEDVVKTKYGDCKDFATLFVKLARASGIFSDVALVHRSNPQIGGILNRSLPSIKSFNHAIVRVSGGSRPYWVDPTNKTTYGPHHREDIALKPVLALDGKNVIQNTATIPVNENFSVMEKSVSLLPGFQSSVEGKMDLRGELPFWLITLATETDRQVAEKFLFSFVGQGEDPGLIDFKGLGLKDKTYEDLNLSYQYHTRNLVQKGDSLHINLPSPKLLYYWAMTKFDTWKGDLYFGAPGILKRTTQHNGFFATTVPTNCKVETKWFRLNRHIELAATGINQHDFVETKVVSVPNEEMQTQEFKDAIEEVKKCFVTQTIAFDPKASRHSNPIADFQAKIAKLPVADRVKARATLIAKIMSKEVEFKGDVSEATKIMYTNIEEDPTHSVSYWLLLRNILYANSFSEAAQKKAWPILEKGMAQAKSQSLAIMHVRLLQLQNKHAEVKLELPKVLAMGEPQEFRDYTLLHDIHRDLRRSGEALTFLLSAQKKKYPTFYENHLVEMIGTHYQKTKQYDKCVDHFKAVLAKDPKSPLPHDSLPHCYLGLARFDDAVKSAMDSHTDHPVCYPIAETLRKRAEYNLGMYNLDKAENDLKLSLQYESSSRSYLTLARVAKARGDNDKGVALVLDGAKLFRDEKRYLYDAMGIFSDHFESVRKLALKNVELQPAGSERMMAYQALGQVFAKLGKNLELDQEIAKGIAEGEKYVKDHPQDKQASLMLGQLYVSWGMGVQRKDVFEKALVQFEAGRKLFPDEAAFLKAGDETKKLIDGLNSGRAPASVQAGPANK